MIQSGSEQKHRGSNPFASYLDHDHRERENVCFLAVCSLLGQDLWGSPSRGMALVSGSVPHRIQALSDCRETEIRDPRMAGVIHEDVWLGTCESGRKTGLMPITYPSEIAVNNIAGVEEAKAFNDIR